MYNTNIVFEKVTARYELGSVLIWIENYSHYDARDESKKIFNEKRRGYACFDRNVTGTLLTVHFVLRTSRPTV